MNIILQDRHTGIDDEPRRWTFGTQGKGGRFGGAHPDGTATLTSWVDHGVAGQALVTRHIKCRSYRRAVRVLRRHLMGYTV